MVVVVRVHDDASLCRKANQEDPCRLTCPMRWMMYSMMMETRTRTKQTTATAHVGVCSSDLPPVVAAMDSPSLYGGSAASKYSELILSGFSGDQYGLNSNLSFAQLPSQETSDF